MRGLLCCVRFYVVVFFGCLGRFENVLRGKNLRFELHGLIGFLDW